MTDGSVEIAERLARGDRRIRFVAGPRQGRVQALISAVEFSEAPFFGILDSDDRLSAAALAETMRPMQTDPDAAIVYTNHRVIDVQGKDHGLGHRCRVPFSMNRLLVTQMVFHFRLFRREIYDEVGGFDPSFEYAEDYDLVLKLSEAGHIHHVPKALYDYRVHADSLSHGTGALQRDASRRAIENALARRGVANQIVVHVSPEGVFSLTSKDAAE